MFDRHTLKETFGEKKFKLRFYSSWPINSKVFLLERFCCIVKIMMLLSPLSSAPTRHDTRNHRSKKKANGHASQIFTRSHSARSKQRSWETLCADFSITPLRKVIFPTRTVFLPTLSLLLGHPEKNCYREKILEFLWKSYFF